MKIVLTLLITLLAFSPILFADDIPATTVDGRGVILHEDGTWEFADFAEPVELKRSEQAEEFVKNLPCSRGGTIGQYLTRKVETPSVEDLGWHVYPKEEGFEVERILLVRQKIQSKYKWYVYKTGKATPLNGKSIGITKEK
ncbi:MAG: hypothetical protein ACYSTS_16315 [Planctomycetota bacterium]|jgi:hypothetical protein